ncbi:hypothetical protein, partial [Xanthovirga aplysinae]|uniref:hypothetical protein n=1 Tax=Xanthovirga aplysinae TaxID=2529853 RepID=UPI001CA3F145
SGVQFINDTLLVDNSNKFDKLITVALKPRTIHLDEVSIIDLPTEGRFKRNLLAHEPNPEEEFNIPLPFQIKVPKRKRVSNDKSTIAVFLIPVNSISSKFSKKEKEKRAYSRILNNSPQQKIIDSKFNKKLVQDLTSFEGDQLDRFMIFCRQRFSTEYLLKTSSYDIILAINNYSKEFLKMSEIGVFNPDSLSNG